MLVRDGAAVRVTPHENICLIRSGQDWSDTDAGERQMYLQDVEPILRAGWIFYATRASLSAASPIAT